MIQVQIIILYQDQREYLKMNNLSRFESDQRPSVAGFLIVLDEWKRLGWVSGEEYILDLELGAEVVLGEGSFTIKNLIVIAK